MKTISKCIISCVIIMLVVLSNQSIASRLWSTDYSLNGPGSFFGPGAFTAKQKLFSIEIKNISFLSEVNFVVPFFNNGESLPNICGEENFRGNIDGRFSSGEKINENANMCVATIAGTKLLVGVIENGPYNGRQYNIVSNEGDIIMTMDLALDLGIGDRGVIKMPFYGTSGKVTVPYSLQTQGGKTGIDQAGIYPSGSILEGRVGDFNNDGWIDGTLVAVGNLPLNAPIYPGQPFAMERHFETDIPIRGRVYANSNK